MHGSLHSQEAYAFYDQIGASQRCKSIIKDGFKIPWSQSLPKFWWKNNASVSNNFDFVRSKIDEWEAGGFVRKLDTKPLHISPLHVSCRELYTGEKKLRLCIDGTYVNQFILTEKTKLPSLRYSENLIQHQDFVKIHDLRNCYFHCKLHESERGKICFAIESREDKKKFEFYEFLILIYGLKPATLVINILTRPLQDHLLSQGVRSIIFIDDLRVANQRKDGVEEDSKKIKEVYGKAGWIFAEEKESEASQVYIYLGFIFDTRSFKYSIIEGKIVQVEKMVNELSVSSPVALRTLAKIVGKIVSFELGCSDLPKLSLHYYFRWIAKMVQCREDWNRKLNISKQLIKGFMQAVSFVKKYSGKIRAKHYNYQTYDLDVVSKNRFKTAVLAGDGNELYGCSYSVGEDYNYQIIKFSEVEGGNLSSSYRELLVLHDSIRRNCVKHGNKDIIYFTDSRVLQFWFQNGSAKAEVADKIIDIKDKCLERNIILEVVWKSRDSDIIKTADTSCKSDTDDYSLPHKIYGFLVNHFGLTIECDLFASTLLHRHAFFYSRIPTCGSRGANALKFPWDKTSYCHPPAKLLFKVFKKIEAARKLNMILIILQTNHDTDFKLFLDDETNFKPYVKGCVEFESRVHCPNPPTKFMLEMHSWWALHIRKCGTNYRKTIRDIYYYRS